jgi:hypothetical protein
MADKQVIEGGKLAVTPQAVKLDKPFSMLYDFIVYSQQW